MFFNTLYHVVIKLRLCFPWGQDPSGVMVYPNGFEQSFSDSVSGLRNYHGDQQGKRFRVWVDRVFASQISSDTWLVKLNKWESYGETFVSLSLAHILFFSAYYCISVSAQ